MTIARKCPASSRHARLDIIGTALFSTGLVLLAFRGASAATGQPAEGARVFRACAACHSLEARRHRTGPSLAGILGRRAGTADGFRRYSPALAGSDLFWDETTLDAWIHDPAAFIPGNWMRFPGIRDDQARADLIAYLKQATSQGAGQPPSGQGNMMGGMMGAAELPDLKTVGPENQVTGIRHCADTYEVTTADGVTEPLWESNLRFKTDGSDLGPEAGRPVILGAGMMGDRASVVFRSPKEISAFIQEECPK